MHLENDDGLRDIDLNLLVALAALLREQHVTRAATSIGLTQPAMSHALARLRTTLGDPLLVRGRTGLQLTKRAEALAEPLDRALGDISRLLAKPAPFEPRTARRRFRIATTDYIEIVLLPVLLEQIAQAAPNVDIILVRHDGHSVDALVDGLVDVLLVPPTAVARDTAAILSQRVMKERFVCAVREDHPTVGKRMTLERYLELGHVLISPRGTPGSIVDDALAKLGHTRRVAVMVPHFLVAPFLVDRSDLVVTIAERVAKALAPAVRLKTLAPPPELELTGFDINLVWHERDHADPAQAWLRGLIAGAGRAVS